MNRILFIILFTLVLSGGASAFFEIIGKSTVKNVEKCINNSSKLLDKELTKDRCITKYQKKITKDIISGKAYIKEENDLLNLVYEVVNVSDDIVITGYEVYFKHFVGYDGFSGTLYKSEVYNADPNIVKINYHEWIEPGKADSKLYMPFYNTKENIGYYDSSKLNNPLNGSVEEFKLSIEKFEKGNWSWGIKNIYGIYIK